MLSDILLSSKPLIAMMFANLTDRKFLLLPRFELQRVTKWSLTCAFRHFANKLSLQNPHCNVACQPDRQRNSVSVQVWVLRTLIFSDFYLVMGITWGGSHLKHLWGCKIWLEGSICSSASIQAFSHLVALRMPTKKKAQKPNVGQTSVFNTSRNPE